MRTYLFENDRLPRNTDDGDTGVKFYMVFEDPRSINQSEAEGAGAESVALTPDRELPLGLLRLFRDQMLLVRNSSDYRMADGPGKKELRTAAVREFIDRLINPSEAVNREIESFGINIQELQVILSDLFKANKDQTPYLVWSRQIH
ncbi:MAG: hypothetical protein A2538_01940 [Candidatus Magasanikbacteria bacterium RIFOXYD2_FULL_41_14]|uniref:Uncharacterized protein n=1 Tax=Candidatus Magasanikbacteria bacterium RIFOXYD2_FULL_41_14 TaxID=1798709 RepID=A0A1F6PD51_9BACT|nr:MAG: hypothetical protein A2538_01940 [Candidatus Magasanikbacteria bacterium RIFOXYD2_FULL_41_14]